MYWKSGLRGLQLNSGFALHAQPVTPPLPPKQLSPSPATSSPCRLFCFQASCHAAKRHYAPFVENAIQSSRRLYWCCQHQGCHQGGTTTRLVVPGIDNNQEQQSTWLLLVPGVDCCSWLFLVLIVVPGVDCCSCCSWCWLLFLVFLVLTVVPGVDSGVDCCSWCWLWCWLLFLVLTVVPAWC
jgi:hypothetical protein